METTTTRMCPLCDGEATYRGAFAGNMDGWGCTDGSCRYYWLTSKPTPPDVDPEPEPTFAQRVRARLAAEGIDRL